MNGHIAPLGTRNHDGASYIAMHLPARGIFVIARKHATQDGIGFDYYLTTSREQYTAYWEAPATAPYQLLPEEINLAVLLNQTLSGLGSVPGQPVVQEAAAAAEVSFPDVQAVSAESLPLPQGAATDAGLAVLAARINAVLAGIEAQQNDALTNMELRAAPVQVTVTNPTAAPASQAVTGTFWQSTQPVSGPLTNTQLRAAPVPVEVTFPASQNVAVSFPAVQPVSGTVTVSNPTATGLTDAQLRATPVPVSFTSTALTDAQARATPLPVAGTVTVSNPVTSVAVSNFPATQPVTGAFFQTTQPVSAAALPLPTGAATAALQTTGNASLATIAAASGPRATGGFATRLVLTSAASINATVVKNTAGQVYAVHASNTATTARYLNFFNKATAPVAGDVPVEVYMLPAGQLTRIGFDGLGSAYATGIAFTITSNNGLLGTLTALVVAGEVVVNCHYAQAKSFLLPFATIYWNLCTVIQYICYL